jgi:hypothetical protein
VIVIAVVIVFGSGAEAAGTAAGELECRCLFDPGAPATPGGLATGV